MKELNEMTKLELQDLRKQIDAMIEAKENSDNTIRYELSGKASYPVTYKQIQYFESLGGVIKTTNSQVLKRMEKQEMSSAIDDLKAGYEVEIN
jgi:hypothetical protein